MTHCKTESSLPSREPVLLLQEAEHKDDEAAPSVSDAPPESPGKASAPSRVSDLHVADQLSKLSMSQPADIHAHDEGREAIATPQPEFKQADQHAEQQRPTKPCMYYLRTGTCDYGDK